MIEVKLTVERRYRQCQSNNKDFIDCESIDRYAVRYLDSNSCDTEACNTFPYVYNVTYNGKKVETVVEYHIRRAIQSSRSEYSVKI